MLPIGDENPHPPGFKPKLTYAFIAINVIVFFFEVYVTGEFFEFTNPNAAMLFYEWGAVPACIVGESYIAAGPYTIPCPATPYITLCILEGTCYFYGYLGTTLKQSLEE